MARSRALLNVLNLASVEEFPIEQQFLNDLKASIELQDQKGIRKPSQTYKPSSMHCIRNMYYQVTGAEGKADTSSCELIGICESGTDRHERLQEAVLNMKNNNIDCEYVNVADYVREHELDYLEIVKEPDFESGEFETKLFHKDLNMSFLCDGIVSYKGKRYILELKTETSNKFWDRQGVNPDHKLQGTAYSEALKISQVLFVYECRDNCAKKAYILNVTDEMRKALVDKIKECDGYVERHITPPKPTDLSKSACAYCGYLELCKGE